MNIFFLSLLIYSLFFAKLGNTIYRIDSTGKKNFNLTSLFTVGLFGPIKTLYHLRFYPKILLSYLYFEFFRLSNPLSAFLFTYYIINIIRHN